MLSASPTSASTCSRDEGLQETPSEQAGISILARLRAYFGEDVDAGGNGRVSRADLFNYIRSLAEEGSDSLNQELLELLAEVVRRRYAEMDLGLGGEEEDLGMDEWVHFMMLRASAPSHVAMKLANRHLRKAVADDPHLLMRLHTAFEEADVEGNGLLRGESWSKAFEMVGVAHPSVVVDLGGDRCLDYYGFTCHVLGMQGHAVELAMYDLSQGAARWVPAALLGGHKFEGIWHSGVRVFGKEYWFGGALLESNLEDIPFGSPTRVLQLGKTLRTREELLEFLRNDVYVDYNPKSYDVLRRNCNHCANELVQFLLHGQQIPEEVLLQPRWARNASLVQVLRPVFNRWLGSFGDEVGRSPTASPSSPCTPHVLSRIDDMTQEWRNRLETGDLVLRRARFIDRPWVVRIVHLSTAQGRRVADIVFFRPTGSRWEDVPSMLSLGGQWKWEVVRESSVPLREFFPLLEEAEPGAQILKAGPTAIDTRAAGVLQRSPWAPFRPICPRGHQLHLEGAPSWFSAAPPCSVCGNKVVSKERHSCARCKVAVCSNCILRGSSFPDGGVFSDILTPVLARELLADAGWLRHRARACFHKADHNSLGVVDRAKARRVNERLAAELGAKPFSDSELLHEMQRCSANSLGGAPEQIGPAVAGSDADGNKERRGAGGASSQLGEEAFEGFFVAALRRALERLELASRVGAPS